MSELSQTERSEGQQKYRIALSVEYDGGAFCGWQRQPHSPSVQADLEAALSTVANQPITVICSGRTDTGVHALSQIVHFETTTLRDAKAWVMGTNTCLPATVAVRWATNVDDQFHARFSATWRRYQYVIWNNPVRAPSLAGRATLVRAPLDIASMHAAAQYLLGKQDFSSFRASACQAHSAIREVLSVVVQRQRDFVIIDIRANAFLQHMVRNITGSLIKIGHGEKPVTWLKELLEAKDRRIAAATALPDGLYFVEVGYPEHYELPAERRSALPGSDMLDRSGY